MSQPQSTDPLLQPLTIKGTTLRNRVFSSSHACGLQLDGFPQDAYQAYHEEKARGGIGLSLFGGSSNVDIDSPNVFSQLNVGTDQIIPHLEKFSERMHAQGAALMCQITHLGRRGDPYAQDWLPTIAPSPVRETLHRAIPREMDRYDINRVVRAYADAARRCEQGGLDGIETLASAHLIGQFMSPRTNQRRDEFGGSLTNRMRFALLVHEAIRKAVSDDFLVGMRLSVDEAAANGLTAQECIESALILQREGLVDFFDAVFGSMDTVRSLSEETFPAIGSPLAPWAQAVGAFRQAVGVPVLHAARIADLASARYAVSEGHVDLVGMTRAHLADPHIVAKLARGDEARIRPCVGAQHCQGPHRPKCLHNPVTGRETSMSHAIAATDKPRKAVVVGAGPGGLEAARVLAERGHDVSIYEAAEHPGGQVILASIEPSRRDLVALIDWRCRELERLGVPMHFNRYITCEEVTELAPDLVILATGGQPNLGFGAGAELCVSAWDVLMRQVRLHGEVLVFDGTGRHPGPSAAALATREGVALQFVSIDSGLGHDLTYGEATTWRKTFSQLGIVPEYERHIVDVVRDGNRLTVTLCNDLTNATETVSVDQVVVDLGTLPDNDLFESLRVHARNHGVTDLHALAENRPQPSIPPVTAPGAADMGSADIDSVDTQGFIDSVDTQRFELHRIGDALASRNVHAAIYDAVRLCRVS